MTKIIVLNGIHASGKTEVGKFLQKNGYDYREEIAQILISRGETAGTASSAEFQRKVMNMEIERDKGVIACTHPIIIETWHTGNIAHMYAKGFIDDAKNYEEYLHQFMNQGYDISAIFITIPFDVMGKRSNLYKVVTPEVKDFYKRVQDSTFGIYDKFKIKNTKVNNEYEFNECANNVCALLKVNEP